MGYCESVPKKGGKMSQKLQNAKNQGLVCCVKGVKRGLRKEGGGGVSVYFSQPEHML